jgi:hypothetical protein
MKTLVAKEAQLKLLRRKCAKHGLCYALRFARSWVENGQPGLTFSSRELCNFLSSAVEKRRQWMYPGTYLQSRHGPRIYWHMWNGPSLPSNPKDQRAEGSAESPLLGGSEKQ